IGAGENGQLTGLPLSNADPLLGGLTFNGGPGMATMAPSAGSPALGAGTGCPAGDERGAARPAGACDLRAHPAPAPPPQPRGGGGGSSGTSGGGGGSTSAGAGTTGTTGGGGNATAAAISGESLSPTAFRAAPSGPSAVAAKARKGPFGTKVSYQLNQA